MIPRVRESLRDAHTAPGVCPYGEGPRPPPSLCRPRGLDTQGIHQHNSQGRTPRFMAERGARWFQRVELSPLWEKTKFYKQLISDTDVLVSVQYNKASL